MVVGAIVTVPLVKPGMVKVPGREGAAPEGGVPDGGGAEGSLEGVPAGAARTASAQVRMGRMEAVFMVKAGGWKISVKEQRRKISDYSER